MSLAGLTIGIRNNLNDHKRCLLLSLDLQKAFDKVDHGFLVDNCQSAKFFLPFMQEAVCEWVIILSFVGTEWCYPGVRGSQLPTASIRKSHRNL